MSHEVETMAFANEVPWHGLGNRVDDKITVDDMLDAAGLNWKVNQQPLFAKVGEDLVPVEDKLALVRDSDNKILTITGKHWKPLQNKQALEFFRDYTEAGGAKLETAGSLKGGKVVWGLANIGKGFTLANGRDGVKGYILLVASHEVGKSNLVRTTAVRVVCANTMALAMQGEAECEYRQSHHAEFNISAARQTIGFAKEQIAQAELDAQALLQLKMSEYDTVRFLAKFFQPVEQETATAAENKKLVQLLMDDPRLQSKQLSGVLQSVKKAPGAMPDNAWGLINGITHYCDHVAGRNADSRMFRSWLGTNAALKLKANKELLEMAS